MVRVFCIRWIGWNSIAISDGIKYDENKLSKEGVRMLQTMDKLISEYVTEHT